MIPLHKFTIGNIAKKLIKINENLSVLHKNSFPKPQLLSQYIFRKQFVSIDPKGDAQGGYACMITSLIDFSFVRSLAADAYSIFGPPCYDPATLFLLDLFRHVDGYPDMNAFLTVLRDEKRGSEYRRYAGVTENIPSQGTFSNFRKRIGEKRYNDIFHVLVDIFHELEMIRFKIISHDGTLYPSWARYKGCTYFCNECSLITVQNVIGKVRQRILYRLDHMPENGLGSDIRVYAECPSDRFPKDIEKPKIELFSFRLAFSDGEPSQEQINTALLFGVKDELDRQQLCIQTIRSHVNEIDLDGAMTMVCPKLPKDTDARVGVRRHPLYPDKKEKVFGYNAIISTSVEPLLGIELPVAVTNIAGNAEEGSYLVINREQILKHHACKTAVDCADSKYDIISNYNYIRNQGAIPIIDYNRRNEKLKRDDLLKRGYDQQGTPFAPCGLLTFPNGFDQKRQRLTFCCFKQCKKLKAKALEELNANYNLAICHHIGNETGYTKHMYVKEHPRLTNAIPRGTKKYQELKQHRSASERINSAAKEDTPILRKPRVRNKKRADILAQMTGIVIILKRALSFVAKVTTLFRKYLNESNAETKNKLKLLLKPPKVPAFIMKLIQRE
ncbi:MAG: hypothetical protein K0B01_14515 [Syntrophobacterales bacterium]|nr:hypothetical protein [Syntrophobacterales bacterium]